MTKISFDFGVQFDRDLKPISPDFALVAVATLVKQLSAFAGGCNCYERLGAWQDGETLVQERGYTLTTMISDEKQEAIVRTVVDAIKRLLNQKCVAVTFETVQFAIL